MKKQNRYDSLISDIFFNRFKPGIEEFNFERDDFERFAKKRSIKLPKNIGDNIYSFRFGRSELPKAILETAPQGKGWMIWLRGRGKYCFRLGPYPFFTPNPSYDYTKIPDATPTIIERYALTDEQALLAKVRYNRLIDIFTGVTCYSLQNHLRTSLNDMGQVETDELYVGVDRRGAHHVFPVQAKSGNDRISIVQVMQDFGICEEKFPTLSALPIATAFMDEGVIALFSFVRRGDFARILDEKHYKLVPSDQLSDAELAVYGKRSPSW
jgi:hypothetical protein